MGRESAAACRRSLTRISACASCEQRLIACVLPYDEPLDQLVKPLPLLALRLLGREMSGCERRVIYELGERDSPAAASGRRAHHRCSVDGWPWRIDFSRADSRLIASSGSATSISLRFGTIILLPRPCVAICAARREIRARRAFTLAASADGSALY